MSDAAEPDRAGWGERTAAALIDLTIAATILIAAIVAGSILIAAGGEAGGEWIALGIVLIVGGTLAAVLYAPVMMVRSGEANGVTIGKRAADLRVLRNNGKPIGFWLAVLREFVLPIVIGILITGGLFWLVDVLWPLFDKEDRAIHDIVCETHVVNVEQ